MIKTARQTTRRTNEVQLLITLIALNLTCLAGCLEKRTADHPDDYGIYSNVASIISQQQSKQANQSDFKPSNWTGTAERLRKTKRLENYDKYRRYQEYNKYLRAKQSEESSEPSGKSDFQFRRRSDPMDDDYYSPAYYPPLNQHHYGLVYPPPVQPSLISLPGPTVLATSSPAYYHHSYRKYRPSASRSYYHRVYPAASTLRRRLATSPSANYETPAAVSYHATPSAYQSYYYGSGLAPHPHLSYASAAAGFQNTHGLAHPTEHELHHHEGKEVHSLLPIITVIGIGAFMVSGNRFIYQDMPRSNSPKEWGQRSELRKSFRNAQTKNLVG